MTLTGILKSILLVIISVIIWHTSIGSLQFLGYSIALGGLVYYSLGYDQFAKGYHLARDHWKETEWTTERRRCWVVGGLACFISMIVVVGIWQGPTAIRKAQDVWLSNPDQS